MNILSLNSLLTVAQQDLRDGCEQ